MINKILKNLERQMKKSVDVFKKNIKKIRTGRASPTLIEDINILYYGKLTPICNISNIVAENSSMLAITVFDKSLISAVEKAILSSNLCLNPISYGTLIRVPLPPLTEERRYYLIKVVRMEAEKCRVIVRNLRRTANESIKKILKNKYISNDEYLRLKLNIQKITNIYIKNINIILSEKESELMYI